MGSMSTITSGVNGFPENSDGPTNTVIASAQGHALTGQQTNGAEWGQEHRKEAHSGWMNNTFNTFYLLCLRIPSMKRQDRRCPQDECG